MIRVSSLSLSRCLSLSLLSSPVPYSFSKSRKASLCITPGTVPMVWPVTWIEEYRHKALPASMWKSLCESRKVMRKP